MFQRTQPDKGSSQALEAHSRHPHVHSTAKAGAQAVKPAQLPAAARIRAILQAQPRVPLQTALEAFQLLRDMEAKRNALQPVSSTSHLRGTGQCCFDTNSTASWTCNRICIRCQAFIVVLRPSAFNAPIDQATLAGILLLTDCAGQAKRRGSVPVLPESIVRSILGLAGLAMLPVQRSSIALTAQGSHVQQSAIPVPIINRIPALSFPPSYSVPSHTAGRAPPMPNAPIAQAGATRYHHPQQPPLPINQASGASCRYSPPQHGMPYDVYSLPATPAASSDICEASSPRAVQQATYVDEDQVPALPMEVIEMIIKYAALDMQDNTKDGSVLCALMHVSCKVRAKVMQQFASPLPLFPCAVTPQKPPVEEVWFPPTDHHFHWPPFVLKYIMDLLKWASVSDFSLRKHVPQPSPPAFPTEPWEVLSLDGKSCKSVQVDITCKPDTVLLRKGQRTKRKDEPNKKSRSFDRACRAKEEQLTASHVYEALREAVGSLAPLSARAFHPYDLALQGSLSQLPTAGVVFIVNLRLVEGRGWIDCLQGLRYAKTFQFDSLSTLRDKRGYPLPQTSAPPVSAILPVSRPTGPPFPIELIQRVIDHAVIDFRTSKDSSVLRALLHTSCKIRARVVEAFAPIRLQRRAVPHEDDDTYDSDGGFDSDCGFSDRGGSEVDFPSQVFAYVEETLQKVLFSDFSTRRFGPKRTSFYPSDEEGKELVLSTDGHDFERACCKIRVKPDTVLLPSGKRSKKKDAPNQEKKGRTMSFMGFRSLNYHGVYGVLGDAIRHKSASFKAPGLNPYQRLLGEVSLDAPVSAGVLIELTLSLGTTFGAVGSAAFHQTWTWDTVPARDAKGKPVF